MKVWLVLFLVQFPGTGAQLPVFKTVATETECHQAVVDATAAAQADGIPMRSSCTEYDGKNEESFAMLVTVRMLAEGK